VDSQTGSDAASYVMMFIPLHAKQLYRYISRYIKMCFNYG